MGDSNKRKERPGDDRDNRGPKKAKGGTGGRWQTPHQVAKGSTPTRGGRIEPGDMGIWITCMKGKEGKATEELKVLFDEYAERFYDISATSELKEDEESIDDIESSIQKEVASMGNTKGPKKLFTPVFLDVQCVLFFKTIPPVVPVDFVHRMCEDAMKNPKIRKHRFVNRLTPMTLMGRANEKGLEEVGKAVLGDHFQLAGQESSALPQVSYAIRPTIRNNVTLKRDAVIKLVANLVGGNHKVDLTKPDKVIIVEIYQTVCGMSVVEKDWESLKRFNLAEIHQPKAKPASEVEADVETKEETDVKGASTTIPPTPEGVTTDEG